VKAKLFTVAPRIATRGWPFAAHKNETGHITWREEVTKGAAYFWERFSRLDTREGYKSGQAHSHAPFLSAAEPCGLAARKVCAAVETLSASSFLLLLVSAVSFVTVRAPHARCVLAIVLYLFWT
jgi:hypothetical protein